MKLNINEVELIIGPRPLTQDSDTVACSQCHRIYKPGEWIMSCCPKCYNEGHLFRLKSLDEARWWVKYYAHRLEQSEALLDEIWLASSQELVLRLEGEGSND